MVTILRIGHRKDRDKRITTHVILSARAFGADSIVVAGEKDDHIIDSITKLINSWGNSFHFSFIEKASWEDYVLKWKKNNGKIVHLTMYGLNLPELKHHEQFIEYLKGENSLNKLLIAIGGEKVPGKLYKYADWNIAVSNQPHSEVAALAVFLYYIMPDGITKEFINADKKIIGSIDGRKLFQ